jgi:small subunit ribosomal protein S1
MVERLEQDNMDMESGIISETPEEETEFDPIAEADEISDEDMSALIDSSFSDLKRGEVVKGTVISVNHDAVVVDIGSKSEGVISLDEFFLPGEEKNVHVGQEVQVYILKKEDSEGLPVISRRRAMEAVARQIVREAYDEGKPVKCTVLEITKGGLRVQVSGMLGFIPLSQTGVRSRNRDDLEPLLNQEIDVKIMEIRSKRDVILSRRAFLEELLSSQRSETLENIQAGREVNGVVKNLTDFGAFIDLGGVDGLLHINDMSWQHVPRPSDVVQVGQEIRILVLSVDGDRISLGLKQLTEDPWDKACEHFPPGTVITGKVTSLTKYGAFVELEPGVEGLIHISEMSWTRRIHHPSELMAEGQDVEVKVLDVDNEKKRISLSFRQMEEDPWSKAQESSPVGSNFEGEITGMTDFGAFVRLPSGVDGMIHVSDMSWTQKVNRPSDVVQKGDKVIVKVLEINPAKQRISLGLKQAAPDPWDMIVVNFPVGSRIEVEITKLTDFGAFCQVTEGIEGLIHISEISEDKIGSVDEVLKVGDKVTAKVVKIDASQHRIGLSLRAHERQVAREERDMFMSSEGTQTMGSLGELLAPFMQQQEVPAEEPETVETPTPTEEDSQ